MSIYWTPDLFLWFISTFTTPHNTQRQWQTKMVERIKRGEKAPTLGLGDPIKKREQQAKQANNTLASSCSVSHWGKDEWTHYRGNIQVKDTKQRMKYRKSWKEAEEHWKKFIYLFFMKVAQNVTGFFFFWGFRPNVWSAASVQEQFTSQTTIAAVHLEITL